MYVPLGVGRLVPRKSLFEGRNCSLGPLYVREIPGIRDCVQCSIHIRKVLQNWRRRLRPTRPLLVGRSVVGLINETRRAHCNICYPDRGIRAGLPRHGFQALCDVRVTFTIAVLAPLSYVYAATDRPKMKLMVLRIAAHVAQNSLLESSSSPPSSSSSSSSSSYRGKI